MLFAFLICLSDCVCCFDLFYGVCFMMLNGLFALFALCVVVNIRSKCISQCSVVSSILWWLRSRKYINSTGFAAESEFAEIYYTLGHLDIAVISTITPQACFDISNIINMNLRMVTCIERATCIFPRASIMTCYVR